MRHTEIGGRKVSALCLGAMKFGSQTDDAASTALLDRFLRAGGTFVDTADCYQYWVDGFEGHESEAFLGRWRRGQGITDEVVIATKIGAQPTVPGGGPEAWEGLSAQVVASAAERSRRRLGVDRIDLLYTHKEDRATPVEETMAALARLVDAGEVSQLGMSNHRTWRLERARAALQGHGHRATVLQYRYSYLQPRHETRLESDGFTHVTPELLDYVGAENAAGRDLALVAYTSLLGGAYARPERAAALGPAYDHPGNRNRLAALDEVARTAGATRNQVVLSWLIGGGIIPVVGVGDAAQLDEAVEATDLELDAEQRRILDEAH
ncbi:aldo/keto reductase [Nocardiopsis flavescens]|uniref:Predicted oxidoreductase n=1 Tax=Nocardiopsis flavescens TaxID=758803 RepID=A0A1M6H6R3_9ACTN|nr:aldo/keto reductase [Nocardiopsis flavescens]SHJ17880.1 Predicted oxidoreductase [Nocardiopsis flavescens]